jgi:hypothetical protein
MKKIDMLPVIAAFVIALLILPTFVLPVNAALPVTSSSNLASVVTIAEDDLKRDTGVMVLGLAPTENLLLPNFPNAWYSDSLCGVLVPAAGVLVGPELTDEPIATPGMPVAVYYQKVSNTLCVAHEFAVTWPKPIADGWDLLSQHKILATLNGVPTAPTTALCEVIEKEKAKIPPMTTKTPSKRQFMDEVIKTTLQDVTDNFVCKFRWIKPGVGSLDVYYVGPRVQNFIADHMLIVTVGYTVGTRTIWASELQDICILGWSMGHNTLFLGLFINPGFSVTPAYPEGYWSWDDALGPFVSCDEAAAWQLSWIVGGWPWGIN